MFGSAVKPNRYQQSCAANGAAYLDSRLPGWEQYVDWQTLNLSSPESCVLAQLALKDPRLRQRRVMYEWPFHRAMAVLGHVPDLGCHGFSTEAGCNAVMKRAWRNEINRRLGINTEKEAKRIKRDLRIVEPDEAYLASVLGQAAYELVD